MPLISFLLNRLLACRLKVCHYLMIKRHYNAVVPVRMTCFWCDFVSVTQLLERISEVVEQNRLFTSDSPAFGQELETLQQHLDALSSTMPADCCSNKSQGGHKFTFNT